MAQTGFWNRLKANWYHRGLAYSTFPDVALSCILPRIKDAVTVLDIGAGCGTLSIPLAKAGKKVTALDAAPSMIELLEKDIEQEGIKGIKTIRAAWGEVALKAHDVVLLANVPTILQEPEPFLKEVGALARKAVFIIENADPKGDKFYYRELYPLVFNRPFGERSDYLKTYTALHSMGIYANVEIIEYDFDQPFDSIDEAVEFWKEYMGIVTEEHDRTLRGFLEKKLVRKKKIYLARFHKRSAVIWWKTGKAVKVRDTQPGLA